MRRPLAAILFARLLINAQFRIVYPFLPVIARGLGLPLETASLLVGVRALAGMTSPFYGWLSDRVGRRGVMLGGLLALAAGALLLAQGVIAATFGLALAGFVLLGLSKAAFDPAMQAYVSDAVPYERRGRALGIIELTWAGSWLVGVPLAGLLIARFGWQSPFAVLAVLGIAAVFATFRLNPTAQAGASGSGNFSHPASHGRLKSPLRTVWRRPVWLTRSTAAMLAVSVLVVTANENLFMVYGAWFESQFGLPVATLGLASIVIAVAELIAAATSAGIVDRVGKRRALLVGLALNALAYLALPRLSGALGVTLATMVLVALTSEFAIVSALPLVSELAPEARGTVMAVNSALISAGVMAVSVIAPRLWSSGGLALTTAVSAGMAAGAGLLLWRGYVNGERRIATVGPL
jgi:predicted MFS family arabinose efflux permease